MLEWMDRWVDGCDKIGWIELVDQWMVGWMDGWVSGWIVGWMDGLGGWLDKWD